MSTVNVLHILRTIKDRSAVSRTELQQVTGLSWGTITNTTRELLQRNLIRETGALPTKSGRKPVNLAINPAGHSLIGIDLAPEGIDCLVLNLAGETLFTERAPAIEDQPPEAVLEQVAQMLNRALQSPEVQARVCLGVGVSLPGSVDVQRGVLRFVPRLPAWRDVPVRDFLQTRLNTTVRIEHDPACLALAERWFGEAGHAENVLCVHLGHGIGMGILLGGEIFRGTEQMAGEFGHMTLDPKGPACACGDHGCVESYCSIPAILAHARSLGVPGESLEDLVAHAQRENAAALACFERAGTYLGIGLANLIDLFNPDLIVLAGALAGGSTWLMPAVERELAKHAWKHSSRQLLVSRLGQKGKVMGACGLGMQAAFSQDILPDTVTS